MSLTVESGPPAARSLRSWWLAARPKTLTASVSPVAVGTGLAFGQGAGHWLAAAAALLGAVLIQIGTNLTNDYYDFQKGADTQDRIGPVRVTQSGLIRPATVLAAALGCYAAALAVGTYLVVVGGWPVVVIGLLSLLAGYAYTGGPFPLGYHGLGDLFVLVFFGFVAVPGTLWVQAHALASAVWPAAAAVGATGTMILVVNNLRDAAGDARAGKRTLVVRAGRTFGRAEYVLLLAVAVATPLLLWATALARSPVLLALLALPLVVVPLRTVLRGTGPVLNAALAGTARFQLVYALLLAFGLWGGGPSTAP